MHHGFYKTLGYMNSLTKSQCTFLVNCVCKTVGKPIQIMPGEALKYLGESTKPDHKGQQMDLRNWATWLNVY